MKKHLLILCLLLCVAASAAVKPINSQTIVLKPGWNLVTLERPVIAADAERFIALKPITLDSAQKCYVFCSNKDKLKIGAGYWIFSKTAQTIELTRDQSQTTWETTELGNGWNLIGVADNSTWMNQVTDFWQWLDGKFQKVSKEELAGGKAYFVYQGIIGK
ncbi:MAG: hypothetical protein IKZ46_17035 [Victivallales bacterium]|nr:hypothetical protein [Victivallales bacterium]